MELSGILAVQALCVFSCDNSDNKTDPNTVQKEVLLILPYLGLQSRILTKQVNNKQINSTAALTFELFSKARNV